MELSIVCLQSFLRLRLVLSSFYKEILSIFRNFRGYFKLHSSLFVMECHRKDKFSHLIDSFFVFDYLSNFLLYFLQFKTFRFTWHHDCILEHWSTITYDKYGSIKRQILGIVLEVVNYLLLFNQSGNSFDVFNAMLLDFSFIHACLIN